ncbi:aldehyde dehydrogenase family protein [Mycolicibacterium sp.]|uniref:aldehyde dehydrogenase family protein n=1 Tax=Mycolicibacterium sp. TaxID=2320850 RepID=UPI003D0F17D2
MWTTAPTDSARWLTRCSRTRPNSPCSTRGRTANIYTDNLRAAHRLSRAVEAGYVWVNGASTHYWGVPFGGVKSSGVGQEECVEELLSFTQIKAVES